MDEIDKKILEIIGRTSPTRTEMRLALSYKITNAEVVNRLKILQENGIITMYFNNEGLLSWRLMTPIEIIEFRNEKRNN